MNHMFIVETLIKCFTNGVQLFNAKSRHGAKRLLFFLRGRLDKDQIRAVIGLAFVQVHVFGVTDQPRHGISDGIQVAESGAGCPPRDSMKPHNPMAVAKGQEVAEFSVCDKNSTHEAPSNRGCLSATCKWGSPRKTTEGFDMAKKVSAKARAAARKQRDKWKTKRWFTIRAPRHPHNFKRIGETLGEAEEHIIGRVYEMTQQEFDGNFSKMQVVLRFRVTECVGQDALTTFIGHYHQADHIRRQVRRYRGKVDDVVDVVTTDGYLVRMKPLIITQQRVQTSVKQDMRTRTREIILAQAAKSTYADLQMALLDGKLEEVIEKGVKTIYPVRSVVVRKSQLLQEGAVASFGPTLDEIHATEQRAAAELKAKKAAALAEAMAEEAAEEAAAEADEDSVDDAEEAEEAVEEVVEVADVADEPSPSEEAAPDYDSMTVAELKELLKAAGKPVSGKKADLVARLQE